MVLECDAKLDAHKKIIALNFKTYAQSAGAAGLRLLQACDSVAKSNPAISIIACPQQQDLSLAASTLKSAKVFAQHSDAARQGAFTGWVSPASLKASGVEGTLLNHSERRVGEAKVAEALEACRQARISAIVCAEDVEESLKFAKLSPWAVAYEPPELIGSGISVSSAKPEIVRQFISRMCKEAPSVIPIIGAGVSTEGDVAKSVELGASGVLLASAFVKSSDPKGLLEKMVASIEG
ncbi:triose-phosphate isomerase [Candidatus Micrarchaeota archaeon]|nr:triose-phosphate isomerase [Candidatus Micrarchaeota archaeon]